MAHQPPSAPGPAHPYYPPDAVLAGYVPNTLPLPVLLAGFGLALGAALVATLMVAERVEPRFRQASGADRGLFLWFSLCGWLHCCFEAYFVLHHDTLAASSSIAAQLWKEYALSDSRYLSSDAFTLCVESITVLVWGPLSWAAAAAIVRTTGSAHRGRGRALAARHLLQIVVSLAHLYGLALYAGTVALDARLHGVAYFRPEAFYVWVYLVGMNLPWCVVPAVILYGSCKAVLRAFAALDDAEQTAASQRTSPSKKTQ